MRVFARILSAAIATGAVAHLVYVSFTLPLVAIFPLAFGVAHLAYLIAIQLGLGLGLGWIGNGRAWSAVVFALPVTLIVAPAIQEVHGPTGILLLSAGVLAFIAVASRGRRLRGAPIVASALGSALACWFVRWIAPSVLDPERAPDAVTIGLVVASALVLYFASRHFPVSLALPRASVSLLVAFAAIGIGFAVVAPKRAPTQDAAEATPSGPGGPPVVLIVLDTLRSDHLAMYGYPRDTMPKLESFARREAVVVRRAIASSPWTLPTHASFFTGLEPPRHGAGSPRLGEADLGALPAHPLATGIPTLAERLSGAGYRTIGISSNFGYLTNHFGLQRGFARYRAEPPPASLLRARSPWRIPRLPHSPAAALGAALDRLPPFSWTEFFLGVDYERAEAITDTALRALAATPDGSFFLFLNYMDAHDPHYPPLPFRQRYPGVQPALGLHGIHRSRLQDVLRRRRALTPRERAHLTALYDGELAYLDSELDRLLRELAQRKDWPQMMVVITSDHGEAIGEHGDLAHGANLFGESVNVPLFIKPGRDPRAPPAGSELPGPLASVDVFATVLEHAGVPAPEGIDGIAWGRGRVRARSWLFRHKPAGVEDERFERELRSVVVDDWKLVQRRPGTSRLYHVASDPGEVRDLADAEPERRASLEALLDDGKPAVTSRAGNPGASRDTLERLRALGYAR